MALRGEPPEGTMRPARDQCQFRADLIMFSRCANPDCGASFDYRHGQLFRFHKNHAPHEPPPNTHSVQHFWLCGACSSQYTLEYREDSGVLITRPFEKASQNEGNRLIAAA